MVVFCVGMKIVKTGLAFIHLACTVHLNNKNAKNIKNIKRRNGCPNICEKKIWRTGKPLFYFQYSFAVRTIDSWNRLPQRVKAAETGESFKRRLRGKSE
jgi:hypothetical protein